MNWNWIAGQREQRRGTTGNDWGDLMKDGFAPIVRFGGDSSFDGRVMMQRNVMNHSHP